MEILEEVCSEKEYEYLLILTMDNQSCPPLQ
jgi:hypothetical protein